MSEGLTYQIVPIHSQSELESQIGTFLTNENVGYIFLVNCGAQCNLP